jgi:hypothetical protein
MDSECMGGVAYPQGDGSVPGLSRADSLIPGCDCVSRKWREKKTLEEWMQDPEFRAVMRAVFEAFHAFTAEADDLDLNSMDDQEEV